MTARKLHINFCSPQAKILFAHVQLRQRTQASVHASGSSSSSSSSTFSSSSPMHPTYLGDQNRPTRPWVSKNCGKVWQGVIQIPPREGNIRSCLGGIVSNACSSKKSFKKALCPCGKFIDDLKLLHVIPRKYLGLQFQDWRHISDWMQFGQKIRLRTSSGSVNKFRHKSGELSLILRWYRLAQTQLKHVKSPWPRPSSGRVSTKV